TLTKSGYRLLPGAPEVRSERYAGVRSGVLAAPYRLTLGRRVEQGLNVESVAGGVCDGGLVHHGGQRLATADVGIHGAQLAGLVSLLGVIIGTKAPAMRLIHDALAELTVSDGELFSIGDRVE